MSKYVIGEPQKVLTLKALIDDVKAMERTKMLLNERTQGSLDIIKTISKEFTDSENTNMIYEVFYNLKTDENKHLFPNGRNVTDVNEKMFDEMKGDDSLEIIHFNIFNLSKLQNVLETGE